MRRAVLPDQCCRWLSKVVGEVEHDLRVVTGSPFRVARLLATDDASCERKSRPCHDRWAHRDEFLVVKGDLSQVPGHVLKLRVT